MILFTGYAWNFPWIFGALLAEPDNKVIFQLIFLEYVICPICSKNKADYFGAKAKQEVGENALQSVTICRTFCSKCYDDDKTKILKNHTLPL